jgi:hypothetical protein
MYLCLGHIRKIYQQSTPPILPEFGPPKGLAAPKEAMYIHLESKRASSRRFSAAFYGY